MNSYEREVIAKQQARRLWQIRGATVFAGAIVMGAALWSSGMLDNIRWPSKSAAEPEAPIAASPAAPSAVSPGAAKSSPQLGDENAVGKMRLVATAPGRNVREGTAQIATGKGNTLTYIAGALLANGASLTEVHGDHVVLKRGASTTELYVDGVARSARGAKSAPVLEELITVQAPVKAPSKLIGPETYSNLMRTAPKFEDDTLVGFQVYAGSDGGALSRLELQPGDVLTELDGKAVKTADQVQASLKAVSEGASVMATVLRGTEMAVVSMDGTKLKEQMPPLMADMPR